MRRIEYRATYAEGQTDVIAVYARTIDTGFVKALRLARAGVPEAWGNLHSIEFWQVTS